MKPHFRRVLTFIAALTAPVLASAQTEVAPPSDPEASEAREIPLLTAEQLDELLGPIALYPDALIAVLLPASTMPTDLVLAARYLGAGGDASKVDAQPWDESVRALAHYPEVVKWMDEKLSWSIMVGDAFVAQPVDVMQSIQRLRTRARAAGTLVDSTEQKVVEEEGNIRIVPAQPEVIYVPVYDPKVVYVSNPYWGWGYYAPPITYRWCYPTGIWLSYDCDWYSWRVWCVNPHWRHDWYYGRAWYRPYPRPPHHYHDNHDYGRGWSPHRGGGHPDYRRDGRDRSTRVVVRDGHREYPRSPDFGGPRGGDRTNGGRYVEGERRGPESRSPGAPDRRRGGDYSDGRSGGRDTPGGPRVGRGDDSDRPARPSPGNAPRNPAPVVRDSTPGSAPAPRPGRWIDRATNPANPAPAVTEPRSRPNPTNPRVVTSPEAPRRAPVVRNPAPSTDSAPRPGRWVDRAATPGNPPPVRTETPRSRPAPAAPRIAPAPSAPAPERSQVVRVPVAGGGSRSVVVTPPAERSAPRQEIRSERPQRGGERDSGERQSGRRRSNDG
ncbi:MAG: DUF3300 domain-containing protein [Opitutaceae bacterium]|nr:DUF3300 domain-containing protein [Opitutaceae bacterium]